MPERKQTITDDPFLCTCGPCKQFWRETFGDQANHLYATSKERAKQTSTLYREEHGLVKVGDRVEVCGEHQGVVKYVGILDESGIAPEMYVGVKLDEQVGSVHNGVYKGKRYFFCPRGHGAFVSYSDVRPIFPPDTRPPLTGNFMYPSYDDVKARRKERAKKIKEMQKKHDEQYPKSKTVKVRRTDGRMYCSDANDLLHKDMQQRARSRPQGSDTSSGPPPPTARERRITKYRDEFGGGLRGEQMAATLRKLYQAYDKGAELMATGEEKGLRDSDDDDDGDHHKSQGRHSRLGDRAKSRSRLH